MSAEHDRDPAEVSAALQRRACSTRLMRTSPTMRTSCLQLDTMHVENRLPDMLDQLFNIGCRSVVPIDDEVGVLGRNLGAANSIAL